MKEGVPTSLDIVMPLYGRTDQFRAAVESVLAQESGRWRLVVIDDHNPDPAAAEWYRGLADRRLEYRRTPRNLGPGPVFQIAAEAATAERCTIMGCDDVLEPNYVRRILELHALAPEIAMIQPGVSVIDGDGDPARPLADRVKAWSRPRIQRPSVLRGDRLAASLLRGNWLYFPSIAWRTDLISRIGFRSHRHIAQDLTLELELILEGGAVLLDTENAFLYRRHGASASSRARSDGRRFLEESELFEEIAIRTAAIGWTRSHRAARTHWTSRLNAALALPGSVVAGDRNAVAVLARHILAPRGRRPRMRP